MHVLLAFDGSPAAEAALHAVRTFTWPAGTTIEVTGVSEPSIDYLTPTFSPTPTLAEADERARNDLEALLDEAAATLERPGLIVRRTLHVGRPATRLVAAAQDVGTGLIVVGHRGRGPITSMVLGSVSAEVVDHAPCPVLVVRGPVTGGVLVAVDGSAPADAAVTYLVAERFLAGRQVEVVSIAPGTPMPLAYDTTGISDIAVDSFSRKRRDALDEARQHADNAARRLRAAGYTVAAATDEGDAAREIRESARRFGCDLIVVGSRGLTGFSRVVLGSVARDVLFHAEASVLIVHEPLRERGHQPTRGHLVRTGDPVPS
jgi:nucleotide-binding universal stress UspA family protein